MVTYLVHKFIPNWQNTGDSAVRSRYGILSGVVGIAFNLLLFLGKFLCGILTSSISIIADAFNNLSDASSCIVTMCGFKMAGQKPDVDHPFGHGRIEYLTGLLVSIVIILVGFSLLQQSFTRILHPEKMTVTPITFVILIASILVKFYMYLYNHGFAKALSSVALESTAADSRNDCITTGVVLATQIFTFCTGLVIDGWTGLAVSCFILYSGVRSAIDTINPLLGQEADPALVHQIYHTVNQRKNILGMHDLIIHDYGPGRRMMSLHAEVPASMSLTDAHELADSIELQLAADFGIETVIHIDPVDLGDAETAKLREALTRFLSDLDPRYQFHDFRIAHDNHHTKILFDVMIPFRKAMPDEQVVDYLKMRFRELDPSYRVVVYVDHFHYLDENESK